MGCTGRKGFQVGGSIGLNNRKRTCAPGEPLTPLASGWGASHALLVEVEFID